MAKITGDCPHCKKQLELDKDKIDFVVREAEKNQLEHVASTSNQILEPQIKEVEKIVEKVVTRRPKNQPNYKCKDGKCGNMHPNSEYSEAPKSKCSNCGQFIESNYDVCPWCSKDEFEEVTQEDREEMGIPEPKPYEHNHDEEDE